MPKRKDIKKILVVGAGPIIIGQACEFDYSGTQACKALKDEGYKVILINSNPATIMTDPDVADKTYIEPITLTVLEKILAKEKPDAILPTMGGQTALNLAMEAEKKGILRKYKIELIGANSRAISNAEDRKKFRKNMLDIGLALPKSKIVNDFRCIFIGGPSGKYVDEYLLELEQTVKDFNLETHVEFLDNLEQTKIIELLNKAKLLIHTSRFETFGLVAIEANTMGVPVLTINNGSLMEIIENNKNGYLTENLIDSDVNNFVKNLLNENKKFEEISSSCIEKSKKYDWVKTSSKIEKEYELLLFK